MHKSSPDSLYAAVLNSTKGWAGVIRFNDGLRAQFDAFYNRPDTFSLGVCNGCQLMALLGWVPFPGLVNTAQPRFIRNESARFESRFSTVQIQDSPAIMFRNMAGASLGVWVAHGEGRAFFPRANVLARVIDENLCPVRYVDDDNTATEAYPFNPNGRHLAMMPHPERTFLNGITDCQTIGNAIFRPLPGFNYSKTPRLVLKNG